jgi:hypothetical protein
MRTTILVLTLAAGCLTGTLRDEDCLPTTGDNCSCEPQCMTRAQIRRIRSVCDMDCGEMFWDCVADGRTCLVDGGDGDP